MQPFTGIESSGDFAAEPRAAQGGHGRQSSEADVSYREKPFTDLVDEDKHALVVRKLAASLLGGYRTVLNDYDEDALPVGLHLAQILIYLIVPATTLLATQVLPDDPWLAMALGGALPLVINLALMAAAWRRTRGTRPSAITAAQFQHPTVAPALATFPWQCVLVATPT